METIAVPYIFTEIYGIFKNSPSFVIYLEVALFLLAVWFVVLKRNSRARKPLSEAELQQLLDKWTPEPLVAPVSNDEPALKRNAKLVTGRVGKRITLDGMNCLNLGSHNYLGLLECPDVIESAVESLRKYGVGSCGPRGFYGTVDVHLTLEERLATFMQQEEAVVYSYAFSTIASAIPAYAKRGDVIFVDEGVNFAIQKGLDASRSKIIFFKHNDTADLETKLQLHAKDDRGRRFLVAEGIYANSGEMCPLRELVELRKKYKLRMILDESISFGVLGNGRGILTHLGVDKADVDLISVSLEHSISSIGGFCVGSHFIVEHQRLSGLGYCFSASLPPLLTQAAITALDKFENEPKMFDELQHVCAAIQDKFSMLTCFVLGGNILSPVKHLYLKDERPHEEEDEILRDIVDKCIENRLALVKAEYLQTLEKFRPRPSIRLALNRLMTELDITEAFNTLERVSKTVLKDK